MATENKPNCNDENRTKSDIEKHGLSVIIIEATDYLPSFAQWLELGQPILRVVHDNDGDWQFLTGDQMPEDIKLVALEQMTIMDKTLNDVFDLEYGEAAEREFIGGKWTRNLIEY